MKTNHSLNACLLVLNLISLETRSEIWLPDDLKESYLTSLSALENSSEQLPGTYSVSIYLNNKKMAQRKIRFISKKTALVKNTDTATLDKTGLLPVLTIKRMKEIGIAFKENSAINDMHQNALFIPGEILPGAFTNFDFPSMSLYISLPQAELAYMERESASFAHLDKGIDAAVINYGINGSEQSGVNGKRSEKTFQLDSGLNIGSWRLRDGRILQFIDSDRFNNYYWENRGTYAERAIIKLRSRLLFGDNQTGGEIFSSTSFRGFKIETDESMMPDSVRGFAPIIRGSAASAAQVTIRQNNFIIYDIPVPPGPFEIRDVWPQGSAGDLEVTVKESDGESHMFIVPYYSLPTMVREGYKYFSLTAGKLRKRSSSYRKPEFIEGTIKWGIPHGITAYGGFQLAQRYQSFSTGIGLSLGSLGALSTNFIYAKSLVGDNNYTRGESMRFQYYWSQSKVGINLNLAGYRYSSSGFYNLDETALKTVEGLRNRTKFKCEKGKPYRPSYYDFYNLGARRKTHLQANMSQRLGKMGFIHLAGTYDSYWGEHSVTRSLQAGFSGQFGKVSYMLQGGWQTTGMFRGADKSATLNFTIPFNAFLACKNCSSMMTNFSITTGTHGAVTQQSGLNGHFMNDDRLSWNVGQGYSYAGKETGNTGLRYRSQFGEGNLSYGYSRHYNSLNYGFAGAILFHKDGITLGPDTGNGAVLIAASDAYGARIKGNMYSEVNNKGFALLPALPAYRESYLSLDVNSLPREIDSDGSSLRIVPSRGAIVRAHFKTRKGARVIMTLHNRGKPLRLGTLVSCGTISGIIGEAGQVYLSGLSPRGTLRAQWGASPAEHCKASYHLPAKTSTPVIRMNILCK